MYLFGVMSSECSVCGTSTTDPPCDVVVFGRTCGHRIHLTCYRETQHFTEECHQCLGMDLARLQLDRIAEAGSDARAPVFGASAQAWRTRLDAKGPVAAAEAMDRTSASLAGERRKDIAFVCVEADDILQTSPSVDTLPDNARSAHLTMQRQRQVAMREWLDMRDGPVTVQDLLDNGIDFRTAEGYVLTDTYKKSFLAWRKRFNFGGADLVALGATWEDLLETGLQATNLLSVFDDDITPLVDTLHITYVEVVRDICNDSWNELARLGLTAQQLGEQLGCTAYEISMQANCVHIFKAMAANYSIEEFVDHFQFTLKILADMYNRSVNKDSMSCDKFQQVFCMRGMGWTNDECERFLHIRFKLAG